MGCYLVHIMLTYHIIVLSNLPGGAGVAIMAIMIQKKISIKKEQGDFLSNCKEIGFPDQSSLVRAALDVFINEIKRKQRRSQIAKKSRELAKLYEEDASLTAFTAIDGDDLHETS